jgi:hypothetical protein
MSVLTASPANLERSLLDDHLFGDDDGGVLRSAWDELMGELFNWS